MGHNSDKPFPQASFVERAPNRKKILKLLSREVVYTPKELSSETNLRMPNISRALSQLEEKDLVNCLNPDASKYRYFEITEKGKEVMKLIQER